MERPKGMSRGKRFALGCGVAVLVVFGYLGWRFGIPAFKAYQEGFFDPQMQSQWEGDTMANLKELHRALLLYQEGEGQLPDAAGWMDAAWTRVKTADLSDEEVRKKFVNALIRPPANGVYGYAMDAALSQRHTEDVASPATTPLVFDSKDTAWNAHGDPKALAPDPPRPGGNKAVTVEGNVVDLASLLNP